MDRETQTAFDLLVEWAEKGVAGQPDNAARLVLEMRIRDAAAHVECELLAPDYGDD